MTFEQSVRFSSFRLDLLNQQLWRGETPVPIRPKTFAVLRYLVAHPDRLVTRDELVKALWPDTHGAEKGPKQCILELRAALGERVCAPQFIETVGRLGYRFIGPLANAAQSIRNPHFEVQRSEAFVPHIPPPAPILVGRDAEFAQLCTALNKALGGERQAVLVTGEPGIGKTSIVDTFLNQIATREGRFDAGDIWIGRGQCIEQYGEGEPYLPVLEALGRLMGPSGNTLVLDLLRRYASSWLAQLPGLVSAAELGSVQQRLPGATQHRMLREVAEFVGAATAQVPLILVLEDLHWSDYSTLDFVSAVTQRREPARLLLIGTYRATDIANGHPLRPVAQELLAHGLVRELPLAGISATAVQEYLDTRFPHHTFPASLAAVLHRQTEGNPLFLVSLVEDLIAQALLSQAGGLWTLRVSPESIAVRVPDDSRRLIEKQMERVAPEVRQVIEAASIAGVEFTAETAASVLNANAEDIEEQCDALARQHLFLRRIGVEERPDGTRTTRYGFRHAVYQQLWSERVPARRQQRLHLSIGERQVQLYGQRAGEIAAELAVHFDKGGDYQRAVQYRSQAAQNALQRSAHREAIDHLNRGLESLKHLPDTAERAQQELSLQILLGAPLTATKGYAAPEVERAYTRSLELSEQVRDASHTVQALLGLWVFYFLRAELQTARRLGERCLRRSQHGQASALVIDAHNALAATLLWLGELTSAREHIERGLAIHDARQHHSYVLHDATDPGVDALSNLALALWCLGYPDQALKMSQEARALAQRLSHPYSLGYALNFGASLHCFRRETQQTQELAEASMTLASEQGFPFWSAIGTILRGWALVAQGQGEEGPEGLEQIRQGLIGFQAIGAELCRTAFLSLLAESYAKMGEAEKGLRVLAEALTAADNTGERLYEAEIHRLKGELTLQLRAPEAYRQSLKDADRYCQISPATAREAEGYFVKAIEVARVQHAKSWELRAAMSLTRLWRHQKKVAEARALLSEIYGWFTEGLDTHDLQDAKALLEDLSPV